MKARISEYLLTLLVCVAPWAFGAVEAWAELSLYVGILLLTLLNRGSSVRSGPSIPFAGRLPGLALGGLILLAVFQAAPLPRPVRSFLAANAVARETALLPVQPERVVGDTGLPVGRPSPSLSIDADMTWQIAARLAAVWLLFQSVLGLRENPGFSIRFARIVVVNAALLSTFAIVQNLTWNGRIYWIRPADGTFAWNVGGPFLNHSHLAAYLNLGLGLALGLLFHGEWRDFFRRESTQLWVAFAAGLIAVGVISSHSRSGFLGLMVAGVVLAALLGRRLVASGFGLAIVAVMIGFYLLLLGSSSSSSFGSRLATILDARNEGYQTRIELWRAAIDCWRTRPIWGYGLGAFPAAISPFAYRSHPVFFSRADNEYLDVLVESGLVGLSLIAAFMAGVGWLGYRSLTYLPAGSRRGVVGGAIFGMVALAVQSCADYAPHVPGVGMLAVTLCAIITRVGLTIPPGHVSPDLDRRGRLAGDRGDTHRKITNGRASDPFDSGEKQTIASGPLTVLRKIGREFVWIGSVACATLLVILGSRDAWVERLLDKGGLPAPGIFKPTVGTLETSIWGLDENRTALEAALRWRPNWSEGHVRLGLVHLGLYRNLSRDWLEESGATLDQINQMAEPLWLLGTIEDNRKSPDGPALNTALLEAQPVTLHLAQATRSFLQARRCSPFLALPHAELAATYFLLRPGDSATVYIERGLTLAGNDWPLLTYLAQVAVQVGDKKLAARCWRRCLEIDREGWPLVADAASLILSPEEILSDVATDGFTAIRFADRVLADPDSDSQRQLFYETGLSRLEALPESDSAERIFLEGHALAHLDRIDAASEKMESALTREPSRLEWRGEYIDWLMRWKQFDKARQHALKGQYFAPQSEVLRNALERSAEALAHEDSVP
jgi:O-antigen ligase/tetratricopeptide (TPR) repeat protein